jgi:hypothetical protein
MQLSFSIFLGRSQLDEDFDSRICETDLPIARIAEGTSSDDAGHRSFKARRIEVHI